MRAIWQLQARALSFLGEIATANFIAIVAVVLAAIGISNLRNLQRIEITAEILRSYNPNWVGRGWRTT